MTRGDGEELDDGDTTMAKERLNEAILFAEHVEKIKGLKTDTRKTEALWLITSKSTARALDFDTGGGQTGSPSSDSCCARRKNKRGL